MSTTNDHFNITPKTLWDGVGIKEGDVVQGKYKILQLLGEGGMGQVFLAYQENLRRKLVLKILKPSLCTNQVQVQRFQREAELASQLNHPNTITIYDFGIEQGIPFIAMEYLEGICLSDALEQGRIFSTKEILEMMKQMCSSLAQAHQMGVIHRDLKPENIFLLNQSGIFVKILDFGIAKLMEDKRDGRQKLTQGDMIFGTPHYMSPEQIKGEELDPRSDVYALGVMLYQIITSHLPFQSDSVIEILTKHITTPVPILDLNRYSSDQQAELKPLDEFLAKAMAKDKNERIPTVTAFAEQLTMALEQQMVLRNPTLSGVDTLDRKSSSLGKAIFALLALLIAGYVSLPYLPEQLSQPIYEQIAKIKPMLPMNPNENLGAGGPFPQEGDSEEKPQEEKPKEETKENSAGNTMEQAQKLLDQAQDMAKKAQDLANTPQNIGQAVEQGNQIVNQAQEVSKQAQELGKDMEEEADDAVVVVEEDDSEPVFLDVEPTTEADEAKDKLEEELAKLKADQKQILADLEETKKKAELAKQQADETAKARIEAENAKLEAEKAKIAAEKAKLEAEKEAMRLQLESEKAKLQAQKSQELAQKANAEFGILKLTSAKLNTKIKIGKKVFLIKKKGSKSVKVKPGQYTVKCATETEKLSYKTVIHNQKKKTITCFK